MTNCIGSSGGVPNRTSQLGMLRIISAASSSAVQFGDRVGTSARLRAIAVQRAVQHRTEADVYFESYDIFDRALPVLHNPAPGSGDTALISRSNVSPCIGVGCVRIIAVSSASSVHIGNGRRYRGESRIKHIRQYKKVTPPVISDSQQTAFKPPG